MLNGFPPDIAPATFRDAIKFSRMLGIRYLWIDSLCIVQGDKRDWETEASKMANVYKCATLTLLASYALADSEGFLKHRLSLHSTIKISSSSGQSTEIYLTDHSHFDERSKYWEDQVTQPLDTRGWCLQESYLSNRQLRFLNTKILWSCRDVNLDEGKPDNLGIADLTLGAAKHFSILFQNTQKSFRHG
jgi:hypothetical protein